MTAFAQDSEGWMKTFSPVADKADLAGLHTAVAGDGSVYASSTYKQVFTFANKEIAAPSALSSCIVKYDKEGNELWSVTLVGKNCKIYAMTADTDGTLYVAGKSEALNTTCTGTDNATMTIAGADGVHVGFVAIITKDGVFKAIKSIIPVVDETIYAIEGDPYEMGFDMPIYEVSGNDPMYVTPLSIKLAGDKVYVAASYTGDVTELGWNGAYLNYFSMNEMIFDIKSYGLFSLNKSDLSGASSEAVVQVPGAYLEFSQYAPEAFDFVVYKGTPYIAFFGYNQLELITPEGSKTYEFGMTYDESGNKEHALVLANVNFPTEAKVFHANMNSASYPTYDLVGAALDGDNCILGGTFYGNFPMDNTVTNEFNTSFVASIKMSDCSVNWATPNTVESEATCMIVTGEEIHAATATNKYTLKTSTGQLKDTDNQGFYDASVYNDTYVSVIFTDGAKVAVFSPSMSPSGIEAIKAAAAKGETTIYNLNGQRVSTPQKGLYIVNGKKAVVK